MNKCILILLTCLLVMLSGCRSNDIVASSDMSVAIKGSSYSSDINDTSTETLNESVSDTTISNSDPVEKSPTETTNSNISSSKKTQGSISSGNTSSAQPDTTTESSLQAPLPQTGFMNSVEQEVLRLLNEYRVQNGLTAVAYNEGWKTNYSDRLTRDIMSAKNVLCHGYSSPEVVCLKSSSTATAQNIVQTFKDSPPHNAILLDERSKIVACSIYYNQVVDTAFVAIKFDRYGTWDNEPDVSKENINIWLNNSGHY